MLLIVLSCSKQPAQPQQPEQPAAEATGAPMQVMALFGPGQLGDNGYADSVMSGLYSLKREGTLPDADSLDVRFISADTYTETNNQLASWLKNSSNPFYGKPYKRRLVVITEPYMLEWFDELYAQLGDTDEVLVLKMNEDDVRIAAEDYVLGERIHGLNISAAASARAFCRYMKGFSPLPLKPRRWSRPSSGPI